MFHRAEVNESGYLGKIDLFTAGVALAEFPKPLVAVLGQCRVGEILPGLRRTHEADKCRQTEAETKGEMSRFRAFQTRINQVFFGGCQRVRDTFILFP